MFDHAQMQAKSRLGRMLVEKGMITPTQLVAALNQQAMTGRKLGEILMDQGLISSRQLNRVLRKQSQYRTAAAFAAMIMGPIVPLASFAAPVGVPQLVQPVQREMALVSEPHTATRYALDYGRLAQPLMPLEGVALTLPGPTATHYDNLCLRAPEAMCS